MKMLMLGRLFQVHRWFNLKIVMFVFSKNVRIIFYNKNVLKPLILRRFYDCNPWMVFWGCVISCNFHDLLSGHDGRCEVLIQIKSNRGVFQCFSIRSITVRYWFKMVMSPSYSFLSLLLPPRCFICSIFHHS